MNFLNFRKISLTLILLSLTLCAQEGSTALFLLLDTGARSSGMGSAFTAVANETNTMSYNPAGLTRIKKAGAEYTNLSNAGAYDVYGINLQYGSAVYHVPSIGHIGVDFRHFDYEDPIPGGVSTTWDPQEYALSIGFARHFSDRLALGATMRMVKSKLGRALIDEEWREVDATAFAFDLGLLFDSFVPSLCFYDNNRRLPFTDKTINRPPPGPSLGLSLSNMGTKLGYFDEDQADPLPQSLRIGFAWNFVDTEAFHAMFAADAQKFLLDETDDGVRAFPIGLVKGWADPAFADIILSLGLEVSLFSIMSVRVGRFIEGKSYGDRNYRTYGFSIGPETLRFHMSFVQDKEEGSGVGVLQGRKYFGFSLAY